MPKSQIYFGISAIAFILISCQQSPSTSPKASTSATSVNATPATEKAISYLRSQLKLSQNVTVVAESQKNQPANTSDLCQTMAPTQDGVEIALIAEDMRYILQTNQDASKIEICRSEDAKPETTSKYTGAGYILRYPTEWKVIDLGLEVSGASTVIFTPSRDVSVASDNNLDKILQKLQQSQKTHVIVARRSLDDKAIASDGSGNAKDLVTVPFDAKVKGARSGSKKEFTTVIADSSGSQISWKVKSLTLETDKFLYTIRYYQPESKPDSNDSISKAFELFTNSFALIQVQ